MGTKQTKSDLPQGTLDLLILKIVALGTVHGYGIAHRLQQGCDAKFYRLTRKGKAQLEMETASGRRLTGAVALILRMTAAGAE